MIDIPPIAVGLNRHIDYKQLPMIIELTKTFSDRRLRGTNRFDFRPCQYDPSGVLVDHLRDPAFRRHGGRCHGAKRPLGRHRGRSSEPEPVRVAQKGARSRQTVRDRAAFPCAGFPLRAVDTCRICRVRVRAVRTRAKNISAMRAGALAVEDCRTHDDD